MQFDGCVQGDAISALSISLSSLLIKNRTDRLILRALIVSQTHQKHSFSYTIDIA